MKTAKPGLFGLRQTNREFSEKKAWGKNQFNSAFPAALCCYLESKNRPAVYLKLDSGIVSRGFISIKDVFGINPQCDDIFFAFEAQFTPYQKYVIGSLPRTDLVIQDINNNGKCMRGLEIKLTALPDHVTCDHPDEKKYGCEIVIRPDTISYLACSLAASLPPFVFDLVHEIKIEDWADGNLVLSKIQDIINVLKAICVKSEVFQFPFLIQPIWKTKGKSPELSDNCLDVFVWSNSSFMKLICDLADGSLGLNIITRQSRTAIWLYKMLYSINKVGQFDHKQIIDALSYNTKNDKAFAISGTTTNKYMACERLFAPLITKSEIKNIIQGGGQNLLSPERRFDAILFNSPELFS